MNPDFILKIMQKCLKRSLFKSQLLEPFAFAHVPDLGGPLPPIFEAVLALLVVFEGLLDLLLRVHHKRAVVYDWLVYRLSGDEHEAGSVLADDFVDQVLTFGFL